MSTRVAFWLLVSMIAAIGVAKAVLSDTFDPDLFWHLRVAGQLRTDGIGPLVDQLSFASIREPWTPYSWLAELGMKGLWDALGWRITIIGEAMMVALLVLLVAKSCLDFAGPDRKLCCVVATAVAAYLSIPFLSFRPITFAIVLLAVVAWLLFRDRARDQRTRSVWLIVPLTALLANVHLSVIVVPIWLGCLFIGAAWERDKRSIRRYGLLLAACGLASLATPMLPGAIRAAWFYQSSDVMVASNVIAEMRPAYSGIVVLFLLLVWLGGWKRNELKPGEWLMLIATGILMIRLGRFSPVLAMVAAPIIARTMPAMTDRVLARKPVAAMLAIALLLFAARIVSGFPFNQPMDAWMNRRGPGLPSYPADAAAYVEQNVSPRSRRLINEFNWGGYLAWRLGDRHQVFVDGRTQLYSPEFWRATYLNDQPNASILQNADADAAILPVRKSRFHDALIALGWRVVYSDKFAEVLVPPENKEGTARAVPLGSHPMLSIVTSKYPSTVR